jgi:hypothetical protein
MKKVILLTVLLALVVFALPTHAGTKDVNIVNTPVPVTGEITVTDGAAQKTIRSGYAETLPDEPRKVLLTVSAGKTFILTDIVGYDCGGNCTSTYEFRIFEDQTLKLGLTFDYGSVGTQSVHLNSVVPFATGSDVV